MKMTLIPIVDSELETVLKGFENSLRELKIKESIETIVTLAVNVS